MNFRVWLEGLESERAKKIQDLWAKTFDALGVEGLDREDILPWSLSKITFGQDNPSVAGKKNTFKGKQAVLKRLTRANVLSELKQLDPELAKHVAATEQWLGFEENEKTNANTTVGTLLQKMFGGYFGNLLNSKQPDAGNQEKLKKAPPRPPQPSPTNTPAPQPMPPSQPMMPQQPMSQPMSQPMPNPMGMG